MLKVELSEPEVRAILGTAHGMAVEEIATMTRMRVESVRSLLTCAKGKLGNRDLTDPAAVQRTYASGVLTAPPPEPLSCRPKCSCPSHRSPSYGCWPRGRPPGTSPSAAPSP